MAAGSTRLPRQRSLALPAELSAAQSYVFKGWAVFPIRYGHKTPLTPRGLHDAVKNSDELTKYFPDHQRRNVGITTGRVSGIVVIDVDAYRGGSLSALEGQLGGLPITLQARTRAGGQHLYFKYPANSTIRSHNGVIAPHVDVKADGGYVVAPPSFVEADDKGSAGHYVWLNDSALAELPAAWVQRLTSLGRNSNAAQVNDDLSAGVSCYRTPERVSEGQRNEAVLRYVGSLRGKGVDEATILQAALDFNRCRCIPPLDDSEVADIAGRYERKQFQLGDWLEPKPIEPPLPAVPAFDLTLLPASFAGFVRDQAELMQCPPEYIAIPLMVSAAAALGNKVAIAPKARDTSWLVTPVLWGAVVGRPGTLKSPAQGAATRFLQRIEWQLAQAHDAKRQQYQLDRLQYDAAMTAVKKAANKGQAVATLPVEPEEPQRERLIVNDSTVEKLGEMLRWSPLGVLVVRDELVSLFQQLDAKGQEGSRGFYLEGWNGNAPYSVDRIIRGSFTIQRLSLWLLGGIQPGRLQPYVSDAVRGGNYDDGLLQRLQMLVWPDAPAGAFRTVDRKPDLSAALEVERAFASLRNLDPLKVACHVDELSPASSAWLHFDTTAQRLFDAWREKLENSLRKGDKHPALESHLSKYRSLIPTLALLIHLTEGATGPVSVDALKKAVGWGTYLHAHAKRVYASATNAGGFSAKSLADKIKAGKLNGGFSARAVQRHGWAALTTPDDVRAAIEWLIDAGWVRAERVAAAETGGRPTEKYLINPKVGASNVGFDR